MNTTTVQTTDIHAAILDALSHRPDDIALWSSIRSTLPGTNWQRAEALVALTTAGQIHAVKVAGRTYVMAA